jgi:hypothetical protein
MTSYNNILYAQSQRPTVLHRRLSSCPHPHPSLWRMHLLLRYELAHRLPRGHEWCQHDHCVWGIFLHLLQGIPLHPHCNNINHFVTIYKHANQHLQSQDSVGVWTIGYGHACQDSSDELPEYGVTCHSGYCSGSLTEAEAEQVLSQTTFHEYYMFLCHTISHHAVISHHIMSYHIVSYHIMPSFHIISCHITSYHVIS